LNADKFNLVFKFQDPINRLHSELQPVFFVGKIGQRPFVLISLNPGKSTAIEIELYKKLGWKKTYLSFFEWFSQTSPYYSYFAVFLSGLVGKPISPPGQESKYRLFRLLSQNLVNLDLIPYHSTGISLEFQSNKQMKFKLIESYLRNLEDLVKLCNPKVLFIKGAVWQHLLNEIGFDTKTRERVNSRLTAHIGECFSRKAVWFDKFMSDKASGASYEQLFEAGHKIRAHCEL